MADRTYRVRLSQESLKEIEKNLKDLAKNLSNGVDETTKNLGKESLRYMQKQYSMKKLDKHIGNIEFKAYKGRYKKGFIVSSGDDEVAIYNEFGIGVVGAESPNPLAGSAGYQYNVNSPHKGKVPKAAIEWYVDKYAEKLGIEEDDEEYRKIYASVKKELKSKTTSDTWWYYKKGKWWHTRGYKGKQMYSSLVELLEKKSIKNFEATISQVIGNYGGKNES